MTQEIKQEITQQKQQTITVETKETPVNVEKFVGNVNFDKVFEEVKNYEIEIQAPEITAIPDLFTRINSYKNRLLGLISDISIEKLKIQTIFNKLDTKIDLLRKELLISPDIKAGRSVDIREAMIAEKIREDVKKLTVIKNYLNNLDVCLKYINLRYTNLNDTAKYLEQIIKITEISNFKQLGD